MSKQVKTTVFQIYKATLQSPTLQKTEKNSSGKQPNQQLTTPLKPPNKPGSNTAPGRPFHAQT